MNPLRPDVLVIGGGMAGTCAAVAASRAGAGTLLVERWGFLGGAATAGAVGQFVGWETAAGRRVVGGMAAEIVARLGEGLTHFTMSTGHRMDRVEYDPEVQKHLLDRLCAEAGVRLLFHVMVQAVARDGTTITSVTLLTKAGPLVLHPRVVIDATGECDALRLAGADFLPLEPGEAMQPATLMFRFGPMNFAAFDAIPPAERGALATEGAATGALPRAALHAARVPGSADAWFNIGRVAVDATDPFALSRAEMEGRAQAFSAAAFLAARVPGCDAGRITALAPQLGLREGPRVRGKHVLTEAEIRAGTVFADTIAMGAYPIDIHPAAGAGLRFDTLGEDHAWCIPWRSLVPLGLDNALVAGRNLSATHAALGAVRVMPVAMAMGQAAGIGAARMAAGNTPGVGLDTSALQAALREAGAILPG